MSSKQLKEPVTREYTIHLHKHLHGRSFKTRAPQAIKAIRRFAQQQMGTTDIRLDPSLNQSVWSRGVRNVPHRLRVRLSRKLSESTGEGDEQSEQGVFCLVTPVQVDSFKGLQTVAVDQQ